MKQLITTFFLLLMICVPAVVLGQSEDRRKLTVPPLEAQIKGRDQIRASFEFDEEIARVEDAQAYAEKLIKAGRKLENNAAKKYAFYREGLRVALEFCDSDSAMFAIDQLNQDFEIDFWKFVLESSDALRKAAKWDPQKLDVRITVDEFANQAISEEQFEAAKSLIGHSIILSSGVKDDAGKASRIEFKKDVGTLHSFKTSSIKAQETLAADPDDSSALLSMGNYLIFVKGDFIFGLENWRKCSSAKYKKIAEMEAELNVAPQALSSAKVFEVAGEWFELSEKTSGIRERRYQERSLHWYKKCEYDLNGEFKALALDRIRMLDRVKVAVAVDPAGSSQALAPPKLPPKTQNAVDAGLNWLAMHQLPDGGWSFKHSTGPGVFRKTSGDKSVSETARSGATGMAILAFVKSGSTHKAGPYKKQVKAGLNFLASRSKKAGRGLGFSETGGTMYSHGIVTRAFAELYLLTKDPEFTPYAQASIWYIEDSQDPVGGGWRYRPREPGDTSVFGWQISALSVAREAQLSINNKTWSLAAKFLDGVDSPDGVYFGYTAPSKTKSMDARSVIGMLGRYELGMDKSDPKFQASIEAVLEKGVDPELKDIYYIYYATRLMKIQGGEDWATWYESLNEMLLEQQSQQQYELGSWWNDGKSHAAVKGGRFMTTVMALQCLMEL